MVSLSNIQVSEGSATCDYCPEDSNEKGRLTIDVATGDVKDIVYSRYQHAPKTYAAHAARRLLEVCKKQEIPKEAVAVWY